MSEQQQGRAAVTPIGREHYLFAGVGLVVGLVIGFTLAYQLVSPRETGVEAPLPAPPASQAQAEPSGPPPWIRPDGSIDIERVPADLRGEMEEARAWLEEHLAMLEADPGNVELIDQIGHFYLDFGMIEPAFGMFRRAAEAAPERLSTWEHLGDLATEAGRYEEAREAYRTALELSPDHPELLNDLATARLHLGDVDGSLELLDRAVSKHPEHVRSHFNRAVVLLFGRGDAEAARVALDRAEELDPNDDRISELRSRLEQMASGGPPG